MLCSQENTSYVVLDFSPIGLGQTIRIQGQNEIVGTIGTCFDHLLVKKSLRKCSLLGGIELGEKLPNSSFTGALALLKSKRADLYLVGEQDYLYEDWLAKSNPITLEKVVVGQAIRDERTAYYNLLDNFKVIGLTLFSTYIISFLTILALSFLLNELVHRVRFSGKRRIAITKRIALALSKFQSKQLSAIALFVLFVQFFFWMTQLFLANNIKTSKVVVDTSKLIKDEHELFSTRKLVCLIKSVQLSEMVATSPTNILSRIYTEKARLTADRVKERKILKSDYCLIEMNPRVYDLIESDVLLLTERKAGHFMLANSLLFEKFFNRIWLNERPVYEYPLVIYYTRNKPAIGRALTRNNENGQFERLYRCTDTVARQSCRASKVIVFGTLNEYTREYSGFSNLGLAYFCFTFLIYVLLCALIFIAFSGHHLAKFVKKMYTLVKLWVQLFKTILIVVKSLKVRILTVIFEVFKDSRS